MSGSGCRSVIEKAGEADKGSKGFQFNKLFHIQSRYYYGFGCISTNNVTCKLSTATLTDYPFGWRA